MTILLVEELPNEKKVQLATEVYSQVCNSIRTTDEVSFKLLGLSSLETTQDSHLAKLTSKQRQALLTAYALGYYDIPRKISSEVLSNHLNIDKSTLVEHLRKAEKYIIQDIISE